MTSKRPDEDADTLDDAILLEGVVGSYTPRQQFDIDGATSLPDWPPSQVRDVGLHLNHATLAWFQANHADWREEIDIVLQAWIRLKTRARIETRPSI
jgi:hypothetical protein